MKKVMNLKESKKEHTYGRVCGRKERGEMIQLYSQKREKKEKS